MFMCVCQIPIHLADSERAVCVGRGRFPSPAAALDSAGRCVFECVSPDEAAGSVSSPRHPKPTSAAGLTSCPTHESPGDIKAGGFAVHAVLSWDT